MKQKFELGRVVATPAALEIVDEVRRSVLLGRHGRGDWGEVPPEDAKQNELALEHGERLMSVYTVDTQKVWIITEADRSATTLLLPSEY